MSPPGGALLYNPVNTAVTAAAAAAQRVQATDQESESHPLLRKHPHYAYMDDPCRWRRWRAILDGFEGPGDAGSEQYAASGQKATFLPKAEFELQKNYECRLSLSQFLGVSETAIDQLLGAVIGDGPNVESSAAMEDFRGNVDGAGTTLTEFIESPAREAVGMGISYVIVNGPNDLGEADGIENRAQEEAAGLARAFLREAKAEDVWDWGLDDNGELEWAKVVEYVHDSDGYDSERRYFLQVSVYDREILTVWRREVEPDGKPKDGSDFDEVEIPNPRHGLGEVPVYPIYGKRCGPMMGDSLIKATARADIAAFNDESWSAMARYRHANPLLKLFSKEDPKKLFTGTVLRLDPSLEEEASYVELSNSSFDARESAIERFRRYAVGASGMNPSAIPDAATSTSGESGIAQRVRFTHTQKKHIDAFGRKLRASLLRVLEAAEKWVSASNVEGVTLTFKSSHETTEPADLLREAKDVTTVGDSPTLIGRIITEYVRHRFDNVEDKEAEAIVQEIQASLSGVEPSPFGGGS